MLIVCVLVLIQVCRTRDHSSLPFIRMAVAIDSGKITSGHFCTAFFGRPVQDTYCKRTENYELIRCLSRAALPRSREFPRRN